MIQRGEPPVEHNPTHDARQQYYEVLYHYLMDAREAKLAKDYDSWIGAVEGILDHASSFLTADENATVHNELSAARDAYNRFQSISSSRLGPAFAAAKSQSFAQFLKSTRLAHQQVMRYLREHGMLLPEDSDYEREADAGRSAAKSGIATKGARRNA